MSVVQSTALDPSMPKVTMTTEREGLHYGSCLSGVIMEKSRAVRVIYVDKLTEQGLFLGISPCNMLQILSRQSDQEQKPTHVDDELCD